MYPKENLKYKTIFDKYFIDDLLPYDLSVVNDKLTIKYNDGSSYPIDLNMDVISKLRRETNPPSTTDGTIIHDIWVPVYINNTNNSIQNKILGKNYSSKRKRYGIEKFISFVPKFKNWSTRTSSTVMSTDWIINTPFVPYDIDHVLLFWYRQNDSTQRFTWDKISSGSTIKTNSTLIYGDNQSIPANTRMVKYSDTLLVRLDLDIIYDDTRIASDDKRIIKYKDITNANGITFQYADQNDLSPYSYWIPDGDYFAYYSTKSSSTSYSSSTLNSYISPNLFSIYRNIYHLLTQNTPRSNFSTDVRGRSQADLRRLKRIAKILSTFPLIDRTTQSYLLDSNIQSLISNNTQPVEEIIQKFSLLTKDLSINRLPNNLSNNIINSKIDLFKKLINKYGGHLLIKDSTVLEYTGQDLSKSNVFINQSLSSLCPLNVKSPTDKDGIHIYNNQAINIGNVSIQTYMNPTESRISLNGKDLQLFDVGKTYDKNDVSFYIKDIVVGLPDPIIEKEKSIELKYDLSTTQNSAYLWSQVTGPCLRFDNINKDKFRVSRFTSSSSDHLNIYIYGFGKYTIKGTLSLDSDTVSDTASIYAINTGPTIKLSNGYLFHNTYTVSPLDIIDVKGNYIPYNGDATSINITVDIQQQPNSTGPSEDSPIALAKISIPVIESDGRKFLNVADTNIISGGLGYTKSPYINPSLLPDGIDTGGANINDLIKMTVRPQASEFHIPINGSDIIYSNSVGNPTVDSDHIPTVLSSDNLKITCPNLSQMAIHQNGIFWPIKTNCYVGEAVANRTIVDVDHIGKDIYRLGPLDRFKFDVTDGDQKSNLKLTYTPNNTIMSIDRIILENMRNSDPKSVSCKSFFEDLTIRETRLTKDLTGTPTIQNKYSRRTRNPGSVLFNKYTPQGYAVGSDNDFAYPNVSTKNAPPILSYGGYDTTIINSLNINIPDHDAPGTKLSSISGHCFADEEDLKDGKPYRLCYLKPTSVNNTIQFTKGFFDPAKGWIKNDNSNKSSVLKFNPGNRKTFRLVGAGFSNMTSSYIHDIDKNNTITDTNIPSIYKSSINLKISDKVAPTIIDENTPDSAIPAIEEGNRKKEMPDTEPNLGYRNLGYDTDGNINGIPSDEFVVLNNLTNTTDPHCNQNLTYSYEFPVRGSRLYRTDSIAADNSVQNSNLLGIKIEDIEIKLQFLNYVNTKNLVVWLEINPCEKFGATIAKKQKNNPKYTADMELDPKSNEFNGIVTTDSRIQQYLDKLNTMNSSSSSTIKLFLLNREHIENNQYNKCLHFSDHASKYNELCNQNLYGNINGTDVNNIHQYVVDRDSLYLQPTLVADSYSDKDVSLFKSIIKTNNIINTRSTFAKLKDLELFATADGHFNSNTTFTLNIAVVDDSDEMFPYDNIMNEQALSGFTTVDKKRKSTQIYNSLCYWEVILHTASTQKFIPTDSLGQIDYDGGVVSGYNFIADFTDKKYLLPPVNLNAPNTVLNNSNLCTYYADGEVQSPNVNKPDMISWISTQALGVLVGYTIGAGLGAVGGAAGAIVGAGLGAALASPFYIAINSFLSQISIQETQETFDEHVEKGNYDQWGFGHPDKSLIEISQDGLIWYTLEVPIFKYSNSLILKPNEYKYIKLKNSQAKIFSQFKYDIISSYSDLIDFKVNPPISALTDIPDHVLAKNNVLGLESITAYSTLKIEGLRAFNFFDAGDSIVLNDSIYGKVYKKGYIYQNNKHYSIIQINGLETRDPAPSSGKIGLKDENTNVIMIFKDGNSTIDNVLINRWSLEKSVIKPTIPDQSISLLGEGSYGYGSNILRQDYLSNIYYDNKIKPIYEILNNHETNRYKYNKLNINNNNFINSGKVQGYPYGLDAILNNLNGQTTLPELILPIGFNDETIKAKLLGLLTSDSRTNINIPRYSFMDIKSSNLTSAPDHGTITIENDYITVKPNDYLTASQITTMTNRLSVLNTPAQASIAKDFSIENTDSIAMLEKYHDSLAKDPINICYSKSTYVAKSCPKNEAKNKLYRLYQERTEIIGLLDSKSKKTITNGIPSYTSLYDSSILPYSSIDITTHSDRRLTFSTSQNKDYYWIHIDPNQQCHLSLDSTVKILAETKYYCLPSLQVTSQGGLSYLVNDPQSFNICAPNATATTFIDPDREIDSISDSTGSDRGRAVTYTVPQSIIDQEKAKYFSITKWEKVTLPGATGPSRAFYINTNDNNNDIYVEVTETYWMPAKELIEQDYQEAIGLVKNKVQDIINLDGTSQLQVRFKNIPRKMKGVDQHYDRYEPNAVGGYSQGTLRDGRGGPVNNNLAFWSCIDSETGKHAPLSKFFKGMNEMIFRAFFGSTDGNENKSTDIADTKEPWEWIPYEYDI
jgi:hypothetical protein